MTVDKDIVKSSIARYGKNLQSIVCMEELAELAKEVSKQLRRSGNKECLIEEIADVCVCIEMITQLYDINSVEVQKMIDFKQNRMLLRMDGKA